MHNGGDIPADSDIAKLRTHCSKGGMELLVCMTMYNESMEHFLNSIAGVLRGYAELLKIHKRRFEGKVAIILIADGFDKLPVDFRNAAKRYRLINDDWMEDYSFEYRGERQLKEISDLGFLQEVEEEFETMNIGHCFVRKVSFVELLRNHYIGNVSAPSWIVENLGEIDSVPEIDFIFLAKHKNAGKIESHLWFFKGFCEYFQPKLTQFIDVGTLPLQNSLSRLVLHMDVHENVGGCCGEIQVQFPERVGFWEHCIVSAQYAEYKF